MIPSFYLGKFSKNEVKIFSIITVLAILIIYVQILNQTHNQYVHQVFVSFVNRNNKGVSLNRSSNFILKILTETGYVLSDDSPLEYDIIILLKLLEFYFLEQYNKNLDDIKSAQEKSNVSDFITQNLFLFEEVYDMVRISYTSFKEKFYWNFGEIAQVAYIRYPKMLKKTIMRHLLNNPNNKSLIYYLVQYYYSNKEFRKSKILIKVSKIYNIETCRK